MHGESSEEEIQAFIQGDPDAIEQMWDAYRDRLFALAKRKLGAKQSRVADEEDVAISAFTSMVRMANEGKLEKIADHQDLWGLFATVVVRKAYARIRYNKAAKRGGGAVRGESIFENPAAGAERNGLAQFDAEQLTPETEAIAEEEFCRLLSKLTDVEREIALMKMEGSTNEEIAEKLNCSTRRITRKLTLIRERWADESQT
ncbi:sigma-70 family RNA polymerase sigma factor [Blastopirellula sp. JC732]|uniref:Sigma-70 family RNA polymerase sigma factor n=1 Tax=Blastopirellula sediminis TaxID=2894196 RepID=A0A9X1SF30_9BACT|nr:sigma-70 family RNA polymerase sigma factor [Blastopirellula sediminis]MCC9608593.1 sigma-70 family RNA polymerase sigma factor [Blastopirellula sediminis]MCC9628630.1 sigma-70 family RNA polymerase sigma factor [Blastopirellula sediminis]